MSREGALNDFGLLLSDSNEWSRKHGVDRMLLKREAVKQLDISVILVQDLGGKK